MSKVTIVALLFCAGCSKHVSKPTSGYNAPNITFDNPPNSGQDCTAVFTDNPYKMVITCIHKPLCGLGCSL